MASIVLWGMPSRSRAMRLEAPKSIQKRIPGASTRKQVLNRPPEPNESPEPTNVMLTDMRRFSVSGCRYLACALATDRIEQDCEGNGQEHALDHARMKLSFARQPRMRRYTRFCEGLMPPLVARPIRIGYRRCPQVPGFGSNSPGIGVPQHLQLPSGLRPQVVISYQSRP